MEKLQVDRKHISSFTFLYFHQVEPKIEDFLPPAIMLQKTTNIDSLANPKKSVFSLLSAVFKQDVNYFKVNYMFCNKKLQLKV